MPYLIDGNNLLFALAGAGVDVGRTGLCRLLDRFSGHHRRVHVVFDGRSPGEQGPPRGRLGVTYSGRRSADELIFERIAADTAPRRLTVVSTDRAVRSAARRRRCRCVSSETFARDLMAELRRPPAAGPAEPPEKHHGLTPEQTARWLEELGLTDEGQ